MTEWQKFFRSAFLNAIVGLLPLLAGVVTALILIAIVLDYEGFTMREVWNALYDGAWADDGKKLRVLVSWMPLMLCSTGLLLTFTTGLWNIGIEGQLTMGAIGATAIALFIKFDSKTVQLAAQIGLACAAGAGWALLAAILKTRGGVNEIFGGVALNFIAALFSAFLISAPWAPERGGTGSRTEAFDEFTLLPSRVIGRSHLSNTAVALTVGGFILVALILYFSRFGLQLKAIGKSEPSARALGIPTERNLWLAMLFCGALAGLGGAIKVLHPPIGQLQQNTSGGIGFLALLVVLLASIRPWLVPIVAFVFAFLATGAQRVESSLQLDAALVNVLQGVLVLAVLLFDGIRQRIQAEQEKRAVAAQAASRAQAAEEALHKVKDAVP